MASVGTVTLHLDADSVKLVRELLKAQKATERTAKSMQKDLRGAFSAVSRAAGFLGVSLGGIFTTQFIRDVSQVGREFESLQRSLAVTSGSAEDGARDFEFLKKISNDLGLELLSTAKAYTTLAAATQGTLLAGNDTRKIFIAASQASRALGLSSADTAGVLRAFGQIAAKGKVSTEELLQIAERGIPAFELFSKALGKSKEELFKLLQQGKIASDSVLPQVADALTNQFAAAATQAANDTQSAFTRLQNSIIELKATLAESGINDALATFATGLRIAIGGATARDELARVTDELNFLYRQRENQQRLSGRVDEEVINRILELQLEYSRLKNEVMGATAAEAGLEVQTVQVSAVAKRARDRLAEFNEQMAKIRNARIMVNFEFDRKNTLRHARERIKEMEEDWNDAFKDAKTTAKDSFDEIEEASKQAARNIQDAFADFLFDPFEDGVKGMVRAFLDAIRRMLANQAAVQIFKYLGGLFGGKVEEIDISSLPKKRAMGGPVMGSTPYLVGEQGPELFVPGASGMVIPNHKLAAAGGITVSNVIHVNGADPARTAELLGPLLARNRDQVKADLMDLRARGRF